jgi:hypothetical protein
VKSLRDRGESEDVEELSEGGKLGPTKNSFNKRQG